MRSDFLPYQNHQIQYCVWGNGPHLLIAIPGYADRAQSFAFLEKAMGADHTILVFNLPGHELTDWQRPDFGPEDFKSIIEALLSKMGFTRFKLMGHSFGGRVVLRLLPYFAKQIDFIYLLAPDGLKARDLKYSPLLPGFLRRIVTGFIRQPSLVLAFSNGLFRLNLLAAPSHRFLQHHLKTVAQRARLLLFWNSLPAFQLDVKKTQDDLRKTALPVVMIFGKADRIIPPVLGEKFSKGVPNLSFHLIEGTHFILGENLGAKLTQIHQQLNVEK